MDKVTSIIYNLFKFICFHLNPRLSNLKKGNFFNLNFCGGCEANTTFNTVRMVNNKIIIQY